MSKKTFKTGKIPTRLIEEKIIIKKFLNQIIRLQRMDKKTHQRFASALGLRDSTTLCYKLVFQLVKLIVLHMICYPEGAVAMRMKRFVIGTPEQRLKRTIDELKDIPHLHLWKIVCSPRELSMIFPENKDGKTIFNRYNQALKRWKQRTDPAASRELLDIKRIVDELKGGVKAFVYTRLKRYNELYKEKSELFEETKSGLSRRHWNYEKYFRYMLDQNELILVNEEAMMFSIIGRVSNVSRARGLLDYAYLNPTNSDYLYYNNVDNDILVAEVTAKRADERSPLEVAIMASLDRRVLRQRGGLG